MVTTDDHQLAAKLAAETGRLLVRLRERLVGEEAPPAVLRHEGDRLAHRYLMDALAEARPDDAVLSEEGSPQPGHPDRLITDRVWVVDPLDGTREFGEPPRTDWAVHVALTVCGQPAAGSVALPGIGLNLSTIKPPAASALPQIPDRPRLVVSRTRPGIEALAIADLLGADLIEMGSAGAKAMAVLRGKADAYVHTGGLYEWDSCAPVAVAISAGLHATRVDGSQLDYNHADPYLPDLVVCRLELADIILTTLASLP